MTLERNAEFFQAIAVNDDFIAALWQVKRLNGLYECRWTSLDDQTADRVAAEKRAPTVKDFQPSGPFEVFNDPEVARRFFATEWNIVWQGEALDFFTFIEPSRYQPDIARNGALQIVIAGHPHPWVEAKSATHSIATIAFGYGIVVAGVRPGGVLPSRVAPF
jgi:hypothetical protein